MYPCPQGKPYYHEIINPLPRICPRCSGL
jgi:hypothetical protein